MSIYVDGVEVELLEVLVMVVEVEAEVDLVEMVVEVIEILNAEEVVEEEDMEAMEAMAVIVLVEVEEDTEVKEVLMLEVVEGMVTEQMEDGIVAEEADISLKAVITMVAVADMEMEAKTEEFLDMVLVGVVEVMVVQRINIVKAAEEFV